MSRYIYFKLLMVQKICIAAEYTVIKLIAFWCDVLKVIMAGCTVLKLIMAAYTMLELIAAGCIGLK